ncbi:MAG: hypothetical protein WC860_01975 [Candidatus Margulisiibacteriota bacterium]|jgi:hypothetical protein
MKKLLLLLLLSLLFAKTTYSYTISLGTTSLDFGSYTPAYSWADNINSANWVNAAQAKFTINIGWESTDIASNKTVKVYCFFKNKEHSSYPSDLTRLAILNEISNTRSSGLAGLINFDKVSTSNVEASFLPARLAISTDQYESVITDDSRWLWLQDYDKAILIPSGLDYAKIIQFTSSSIQVFSYYCIIKVSATIEKTSGKNSGNYVGKLYIMSDLQ